MVQYVMETVTLQHVRAALALHPFDARTAHRRMAPQPRALSRSTQRPGKPRKASVLILLFPAAAGLAFVLVRRAHNPDDVHSGQISLPGGAREDGETAIQTALRETWEEVGVAPDDVEVLGQLACLYIPPSDFEVRPVVGHVDAIPAWRPESTEVVDVLECPLVWLLDDSRKMVEDWERSGQVLRVPWYDVHGCKVWGATAIILSEFEYRLRMVMGKENSASSLPS